MKKNRKNMLYSERIQVAARATARGMEGISFIRNSY